MFCLRTIFVKYYPFCFFIKEEQKIYPWPLITSNVNLMWRIIILLFVFLFFILKLIPVSNKTDYNEIFLIVYSLKLIILFNLFFIFIFFSFKYKKNKFFQKFFPLLFFFVLEMSVLFFLFFKNIYINKISFEISDKIFRKIKKTEFQESLFNSLIIFDFFFLFFGIVVFWIINTEYREGIWKKIKENPESFLLFCLIICCLLLYLNKDFFFPESVSLEKVNKISENEKNIQNLLVHNSKLIRWLIFFKILLIAPFWEEIFYRYFILLLVGKENIILFLIFSVFLFSIAHMYSNEFIFSEINLEKSSKIIIIIKKLFQSKFIGYWQMGTYFSLLFFITGGNLIFNYFFHYSVNFFIFMNSGYFEKIFS